VTHHRALRWQAVPAFFTSLRSRSPMPVTRLLFEFLILTVARSGEARGALWREVDINGRTWTISGLDRASGRRMKSGEPHVVPLSNRVVEILSEARKLHGGDLLFPGANGHPLSDNVLSKLMRDWGVPGTPHGFRSAFKDWAAEAGIRDEVSEAALAHADRDTVRAAYRRTRFLDDRRVLMQHWAEFVTSSRCSPIGHVVAQVSGVCNRTAEVRGSIPPRSTTRVLGALKHWGFSEGIPNF
jgi:integrase